MKARERDRAKEKAPENIRVPSKSVQKRKKHKIVDKESNLSGCQYHGLRTDRKKNEKERKQAKNPQPPSTHPRPIAGPMGPGVLYPLHVCPILKNLSMQHISGFNLIQGAIGYSVASPLGAAKSGMKRDYRRNTMSRRNA